LFKVALITGTSKGLGLNLAQHFLSQGWTVIGISRSRSFIASDRYKHYNLDITDHESLSRALEEIEHIDVLINNAAIFKSEKFEKTDIDIINSILDTNLKGSIYVTKCALSCMKTGGKIIFVNSVAGITDIENQSIYAASKHGLTAFASILGKELNPKGIVVSSIHPGGINTTLWNEKNPYLSGNVSDTIDPKSIVDLIYYISNQDNKINYKSITMFPTIEWH
jgi:3-oxoacyl-[acyl-carrier protein] reductase